MFLKCRRQLTIERTYCPNTTHTVEAGLLCGISTNPLNQCVTDYLHTIINIKYNNQNFGDYCCCQIIVVVEINQIYVGKTHSKTTKNAQVHNINY